MKPEPPSALLTDLYQLTMLAAYHERGMSEAAVFEFFVRALPPSRNFLVAAGLKQAVEYLEDLRFGPEELKWLAGCGRFSSGFVESLASFRFRGDVWAMPEGTPFFANEPILQVVAPLSQAQLVETRLINLLHFQTTIASKAARCVLEAPGKQLVDFGLRRAHGAEAGLLAARAAYLAGFAGSSTVLAEPRFGIPIFGTMAHSFVEAHEDESVAFENFARSHPRSVVLLIDTYDIERGARRAARVAARLRRDGIELRAVRIDSGDLAAEARRVRKILDREGLGEVGIFASGNLDERRLSELAGAAAPIDGYGVGTKLDTSADAPFLECAYKLVEYDGRAVRKTSEGKETWPGRKQVWRCFDPDSGEMLGDTVGLAGERCERRALLEPAMIGGRRAELLPSLAEARERALRELERLPSGLRRVEPAAVPYAVAPSEKLEALRKALGGV